MLKISPLKAMVKRPHKRPHTIPIYRCFPQFWTALSD